MYIYVYYIYYIYIYIYIYVYILYIYMYIYILFLYIYIYKCCVAGSIFFILLNELRFVNKRFLIIYFLVQISSFGTVLGPFIQCNFKILVFGQPWWPTFLLSPYLPS